MNKALLMSALSFIIFGIAPELYAARKPISRDIIESRRIKKDLRYFQENHLINDIIALANTDIQSRQTLKSIMMMALNNNQAQGMSIDSETPKR